MPTLPFTVDSALLRELGERLVGRAHIAVGELIKNAYDADANGVTVRFGDDRLEVVDNGHGMTFDEFKDFWMRIGSPHKQKQQVSRTFGRPLTGSKGVGRLAVQFLARKLELRTVSSEDSTSELIATVDWDEAVNTGTLTEARAQWKKRRRTATFPDDADHGTTIILTGLSHTWDVGRIVHLAKEVWMLQPPFGSKPRRGSRRTREAFAVTVESDDEEAVKSFQTYMKAIFAIWHARLVGTLTTKKVGSTRVGEVKLAVQFEGDEPSVETYTIEDCELDKLHFEMRVFHLMYKQPYGISVGDARDYLNKHGGVHVYDAGFRLPYYGVETDWLGIEIDHSHRLSRSRLLPEEMQIPDLMNNLPTNTRLYGVVRIDTSHDRHARSVPAGDADDVLKIAVTRDRLLDNRAYGQLRNAVRWALDYYALQETKRKLREAEKRKPVEPAHRQMLRVEQLLDEVKPQLPGRVFHRLDNAVRDAAKASVAERKYGREQAGLLGALATAGMAALALQHEMNRQMQALREIVARLRTKPSAKDNAEIASQMENWLERVEATRRLFAPLLDEENREASRRLRVRPLIEDVWQQLGPLTRGVRFDATRVDRNWRLPIASYAEWSALVQNVFSNAINATLESTERRIVAQTTERRGRRTLLVEDTGVGVNLDDAERLFEPFERKMSVSPDRRSLGLGGSGLGLTIVRMIAEATNCRASFVQPTDGFSTAFCLSWKE